MAALLALGIAAALRPGDSRPILIAAAALCGTGALASFADLLAGDGPAAFALPLGLPGGTAVLALDPLSGLFLLLLFACATAAAVYALDAHEAEDARSLPFFPPFIAAMALTLLAGDGYTLLFGFELMSLASWAMVLARHEETASRDAAQLYLGMALFSAACLIPAFALLASTSAGFDLRFAAIRAAIPPEGWRATAIFLLVLLGAGAKAGLAPLHVWLPYAHSAAPSHVSALMSGAMTKVALYVLIRLVFDLAGPAQPLWWSVPVLAAGVASAVLGGLRANVEADLKTVLAASTIENVGLIAIGIGVALVARAADLPGLAALALGAALLHALNHGLYKTLLFLGAGAAQHGAGSRLLGRLGGLIHAMPITSACVLAGCVGLAALPPGPGFASEWLLLQSLLAAPRVGGIALQTIIVIAAAGVAMAAALAASAVVRLVGVAFLGRPRTPRAAAATEPGPCARGAMIGLAGAVAASGLLPGLVLHVADPALRNLTGAGLEDRAGLLGIAPATGAFGYAVPVIVGVARGLRGRGVPDPAPLWCARRPARPGLGLRLCRAAALAAVRRSGHAIHGRLLRRAAATDDGPRLARRRDGDAPRRVPARRRPHGLLASWQDPAVTWLFLPMQRAKDAIARAVDRLQALTIRRTLGLTFAMLVLFLALIAWMQAS